MTLIVIFSCKNESVKTEKDVNYTTNEEIMDFKFQEVKKLSEYKGTQFIPTIEHQISNNKNSIYCSTLLFAWDEIRNQINSPIIISDEYVDLKLLNKSTSFKNVLKSNEYVVSGKVDGNQITARAEFNKSLPFETKLQSFNNKLTFDGQKISSFGVQGYNSYEQLESVKIIYYKNDDNFIIKLMPKDKEHEIILFKSTQEFSSLASMIKEIDRLDKIGRAEIKNEKMNWKYYINEDDVVIIPKFNFNIETNYTSMEGNSFQSRKQKFAIEKAWQRTAFILDESGAKVESEAEMAAAAAADTLEEIKPKKMIFDKPFLIILRRTDNKNPYFGLWTTNVELMTKE
jgi:hypothetical protein